MLYILFLIYWCCSKPNDSRRNFKIENRDGLWFDKKTNQLYTGAFSDTLIRYIEGSFKNGKRDGYWRYTNVMSNQVDSEGTYKNGLKHSKWIRRWPNGNLYRSMEYNNGLPVGEWYEMNENGKRQIGYCSFKNGDGVWRRMYENGQESEIGTFSNGLKTGKWKYYYENGNLKVEGAYNNGNRTGDWKFYSEDKSLRLKFTSNQIDSLITRKSDILRLHSKDADWFFLAKIPTHLEDVGDFDPELFFITPLVGEKF